MKKTIIAAFTALAITAQAGYVTVVGTNFTSSGRRYAADMTVVSIVAGPNGLTFKTSIQVPTPNGVYSTSLLPGGYLATVGTAAWGFVVPDTTNTVRMTDLAPNTIYTNGVSFGSIWGTRVTTNDTVTGLLIDKVVAGTNAVIYIRTNIDGSIQLVINGTGTGGGGGSMDYAALAATNNALTNMIFTNVSGLDSRITSASNAATIRADANAASINANSNTVVTRLAARLEITGDGDSTIYGTGSTNGGILTWLGGLAGMTTVNHGIGGAGSDTILTNILAHPEALTSVHLYRPSRNGPSAAQTILDSSNAFRFYGNNPLIVIPALLWPTETNGGAGQAGYNMITNINAQVKTLAGTAWVDTMTWLASTNAMAAVGLTPTTNDLLDIANGNMPRAFRYADGHPNDYAYLAEAIYIYTNWPTNILIQKRIGGVAQAALTNLVQSNIVLQTQFQDRSNVTTAITRFIGSQSNAYWLGASVPGLLAWWTFGEQTGTNVYDQSGNGNTAYMSPTGVTWTNGVIGKGVYFDGVSGVITSSNRLRMTNMTVSCWFNSKTNRDNQQFIGKGYASFIGVSQGSLMGYAFDTNSVHLQSYCAQITNQWVNAVFVVNGSAVKFYTNGVYVGTTQVNPLFAGPRDDAVDAFTLGALTAYGSTSRYFWGTLSDCRVYNRPLSQGEVQLIYQGNDGVILNINSYVDIATFQASNAILARLIATNAENILLVSNAPGGGGGISQAVLNATNAILTNLAATNAANNVLSSNTAWAMGTNSATNISNLSNQVALISSPDPFMAIRRNFFYFNDFLWEGTMPTSTPIPEIAYQSGAGASVTSQAGSVSNIGVLQLSTGTATTGFAGMHLSRSLILFGSGSVTNEWYLKVNALSNATDSIYLFTGLWNSKSTIQTHGVYWQYGPGSANWQFVCTSNSVSTTNTTSIPVSTRWTKLRIIVDSTAANAYGLINDTLVATISTNIPTTFVGTGIINYKTNGTTAVTVYVDWYALAEESLTPR